MNTVLMSVYERVREIGTMMAIGVRRREVMLIFLLESAILGLAGAAAGAALGAGITGFFSGGFHFPATALSGALVIFPHVGARFLVLATFTGALGAVVAALYPAWKASRMKPADALRAT